jgi:hypothetical protein
MVTQQYERFRVSEFTTKLVEQRSKCHASPDALVMGMVYASAALHVYQQMEQCAKPSQGAP